MAEEESYMAFVWAAYAITFIVFGATICFSLWRSRKLKKLEKEFQ